MLGIIGRQLCRTGQAVFLVEVDGQHVKLLPVWSWDVHGGPDPASWWYRLDIAGPSSQTSITRPAASVVHLRYAVDPSHPWIGLSPLAVAASTGRLAGLLEQALGDEAGGPRGTLITTPEATGAAGDGDDPDADPYAPIKGDLLRLKGDVALVESFAAGAGDKGARPDRDWKPERLGADPPAALVELRGAVFDAVLSTCGLSPALFASGGTATGIREAFRTYYRATLLPVGAAVERELSDKLETPVRLDFRRLGAADIATAARAYGALVGAEMDQGRSADGRGPGVDVCDRSSGVLVPCRAAVLRMARERVRDVQQPLFPLGFDPRDVRPEVTAWDARRPTEAGTLPALTGANESVSIRW